MPRLTCTYKLPIDTTADDMITLVAIPVACERLIDVMLQGLGGGERGAEQQQVSIESGGDTVCSGTAGDSRTSTGPGCLMSQTRTAPSAPAESNIPALWGLQRA